MAPALVKAYVIEEGLNVSQQHQTILCHLLVKGKTADSSLGQCHACVGRAPVGLGPLSPHTNMADGVDRLTAPVPSLQWVSKTYSSLNWESVTNLNCFSDLIRIFHL